jgi:virulence factor Mce-like protein
MSTARRTRKRRTDNKPPGRLAISGIVVLLLALAFVAFGVVSVTRVPGLKYHKLYADIPDISNLGGHDEVRIAGVRVGQVLGPKVHDGHAMIQIQLQPGTGRLRADSTVVVRARGLLGSRYLELRPGTSGKLLNDGDTIRAPKETSITSGVADVLDTFDDETRGRFGDLVGEFGQALSGRGQGLNDAIRLGPDVTDQLTRVVDAIEARPGAARRFVPSVNAGMGALDAAKDDIAGFFGPAAKGLAPFGDERDATQATLDQAPATLDAMDTGLTAGRTLLTSTRSLVKAVNRTLPQAPAALRSTNALLRESPTPLRRVRPLLAALKPTVPSVLQTTKALKPTLEPLKRALTGLLPIVDSLGAHACDITNFGDNWRSVLGYGAPSERALPGGDAGHFNQLRVNLIAGPASLGSLVPGISRPFVHNREIYSAPCTHSPGPKYSALGIGTPKGTGR